MMQSEWLNLLPYLILTGGAVVVLGVGALRPRRGESDHTVTSLLTVLLAALSVASQNGGSVGVYVDCGPFARYFFLLLMLITALALLFLRQPALRNRFAGDACYSLVLFGALGMALVAAALHWLIFFLGLELLSIALYVLVAIRRERPLSLEAGLKYLMPGVLAGAFAAFGIAVLYGATGTMSIARGLSMDPHAGSMTGVLLGLSALLGGIGFKLSMVPFHLWTADVYEGAPAPVTAFLASGSKVAVFALLLRICLSLNGAVWNLLVPVLWAAAAVTLLVGSVTALRQERLKRLLAYSSIAQVGYLFMALVAVKQQSLPSILFFLAIYAVMELGAFGLVGALSDGEDDRDLLTDYRGLGTSQPWRSGLLALCLVSLAGLPPTGGFIGKFLLFKGVLQARFFLLAAVGILSSILALYAYLKVLLVLYFESETEGLARPLDLSAVSEQVACWSILALILWLGLIPAPLLGVIDRIAAFLSA